MNELQNKLKSLSNNAKNGVLIVNPSTLKQLQKMDGYEQKTLSKEEYVDMRFEESKKEAFERIKDIPSLPTFIYDPLILSLHQEIFDSIMFGLYNSAIVLCGGLIEYAIKEVINVFESRGFCNHNTDIEDKLEEADFYKAITWAKRISIISQEEENQLLDFKNKIRNPYHHLNSKKITRDCSAIGVKVIKLNSDAIETININAEDSPVIRPHAKLYMDKALAKSVFIFVDSFIKVLFRRIYNIFPA